MTNIISRGNFFGWIATATYQQHRGSKWIEVMQYFVNYYLPAGSGGSTHSSGASCTILSGRRDDMKIENAGPKRNTLGGGSSSGSVAPSSSFVCVILTFCLRSPVVNVVSNRKLGPLSCVFLSQGWPMSHFLFLTTFPHKLHFHSVIIRNMSTPLKHSEHWCSVV